MQSPSNYFILGPNFNFASDSFFGNGGFFPSPDVLFTLGHGDLWVLFRTVILNPPSIINYPLQLLSES